MEMITKQHIGFFFIGICLIISFTFTIWNEKSLYLTQFNENLETKIELEIQNHHRRRLGDEDSLKTILRRPGKLEKFKKVLSAVESSIPAKLPFTFYNGSVPINSKKSAIITCAFASTYQPRDATHFLGTARRAGFQSNIAVVILPTANQQFIQRLIKFNASIFVADMTCTEDKHNPLCTIRTGSEPGSLPVTLIRYYFYRYVGSLFAGGAPIMISDFRDVYFQSNPFTSRHVINFLKYPNDLMVFQEAHPNKIISRDPQNLGFLINCYGEEMSKHIGFNLVSSTGVVFGVRSAITAYSYFITSQIEKNNRYIYNSTIIGNDKLCLHFGVDQGFHNVLLYTNILSKYLDVRIFPQGEGPVNTVGGYFGEKKLLRAYLSEWKILRGENQFKYIYNWNGEISPVVHQLDRFLATELEGGYEAHMAVFQHIYG